MQRTLLRDALDGVVMLGGDGRVTAVNRPAAQIFGAEADELQGRLFQELIRPAASSHRSPDGQGRHVRVPADLVGSRTEAAAMLPNGHEAPVEVVLSRSHGDEPGFVAWIRDLGEQRALEQQVARRGALLGAAEEIGQVGSWAWDRRTDELMWSDNLFRLFGIEPGMTVPSLKLLFERVHPDDADRLRAFVARGRSLGTLSPLEHRIVRTDGIVRHLRVTMAAVEESAGRHGPVVGSVQDVTEQRLAEREIAAHWAMADAIVEWDSLEPGAERLLRSLAEAMEFVAGVFWLPQGDVMTARVFWSSEAVDMAEYEEVTRRLRFPRGLGLPGAVWACSEPISLASVGGCVNFERRRAARRAGLRGALGLPAVHDEEVLAVLELCSTDEAELTERLLRSLTGIGQGLGRFLARRRGELEPRALTGRELEILQLAAHGHSGRTIAEQLVVSPATVKTHFEHIYGKLGVSDRASAVAVCLRKGLIE